QPVARNGRLELNMCVSAVRKGAVRLEYRVVAVLPPLVDEARRSGGAIFHEAVAIAIPEFVNPGESCLDIGPQLSNGLNVVGPLEVRPRQDHEKRCGIDRSIIAPERDLAELRHLAKPHLM